MFSDLTILEIIQSCMFPIYIQDNGGYNSAIGEFVMGTEKDFRSFPLSKDLLDTANSVCWFAADASWMMGVVSLGLFLMIPTIISGLCLLYIEKRKPVIAINVAINCWIMMNGFWMLSEGHPEGSYSFYSRVFFILGVISVFAATLLSKSMVETFSHFRRFRIPR